jgi:catechol 2,3-dioxygenase
MTMEYKSNQAAKFKPRRLGHVNLSVSDLERSMEFYTQVLGIEEVRRELDIKAGFLSNGNTHHDVALIEVGILATQAGLNHLGWELENEVQLVEAYQRAQQAGLKINFTANHQISRGVYMSDPEGNGHEFYADAMKDWRTIMRPDRFDMITAEWTPGEPPPDPEPKYNPHPEIRWVEGAVFHPKRVAQATFAVRDMEKMTHFFTEVGGLEKVGRAPDDSCVVLRGALPGQDLTLIQVGKGQPTGLHHFSFEIANESDLDQAEVEMRKAGIKPELRVDNEAKRSIFLRDPDDFLVEFYVGR